MKITPKFYAGPFGIPFRYFAAACEHLNTIDDVHAAVRHNYPRWKTRTEANTVLLISKVGKVAAALECGA